MTITFSDFFTRFGKAVDAYSKLLTATGTTFDTEFQQIVDAFNSDSIDIKRHFEGQIDSMRGLQASVRGSISGLLISPTQDLLTQYVIDDRGQDYSFDEALVEFIDQMIAGSQSVQDSTVGASSAAVGTPYGNGVFHISTTDSKGRSQENAFAEDIYFECDSVSSGGVGTFSVKSEISYDSIHHLYPNGSGLSSSDSAISVSSSLVPTPIMDTADSLDSTIPSGWYGGATTISSFTSSKVEDIAITGSPTGGYYYIHLVDSQGTSWTTSPLSWEATEAEVQSAVSAVTGFSGATVSTSGTSPNLTHRITYTGVPTPGTTTTSDYLTGGTPNIAVTPVTAASESINGSICLKLTGDGAENTTFYVPLALSELTQYGYSLWLYPTTITTGVLEVSLVDDIGGSVIADWSGTNNSASVTLSSLTNATWYDFGGFFRTPEVFTGDVYLKISCTTAIDASGVLLIDSVWLGEVSEIYNGGPSVFITTGDTHWDIRDEVKVTVTNDYAGDMNQWLDRVFDLKNLGEKFPTNASPTISDSLIS